MHEIFMVKSSDLKKKSIIDALCIIAMSDEDFNGNNGSDYLWDIAKENGYKTNLDYVSENIKSNDTEGIVEEFLKAWLGNDNYYMSYAYKLFYDTNNSVVISVSYVC